MICNIYLLIYDTNAFLNKNTFDLINQQRKNAKINTERIISILAIIEIQLFTHHLWYVCLVRSILKKFPYGRVGGVSRGEHAYPGIQITGKLCYFFWKLPFFSFRQLLIFLFCYTHFSIKFHIHTFFWMDTSSIDYWHFQTLCMGYPWDTHGIPMGYP